MVTAKASQTSQRLSARNPSDLGHMALIQQAQNYCLPCFPPATLNVNVAFQVHETSNLRRSSIGQENAVIGPLKLPPSYLNIPYSTGIRYPKDSQYALSERLGITDKPINASSAAQKRFLIFDQSGNQTRLFVSPTFAPQDQILSSKTPTSANGLREKVDHHFLVKPIVDEKLDCNDLDDEENEMLEDSEEINALLYSDSDDEYDDSDDHDDDDTDGQNDEVTSAGHTPFTITEGHDNDNNNNKLLEELTEEVASSDDPPKRQRLLDGRYKKSSLMRVSSPLNWASSCSYEDDSESSCNNIDSTKREKKVKIRNTLKILESIIPGLENNNDALSIIDKAIVYFKSMKTEAEVLGIGSPEMESAAFA